MLAMFRAEPVLREEVFGATSPETLPPRLELGRELTRSGDAKAGAALLTETLAIVETTLGPNAPDVALVLEALGSTHTMLGQIDLGSKQLERAVAITIAAYGPDHPGLVTMYSSDFCLSSGWWSQGNRIAKWSPVRRASLP